MGNTAIPSSLGTTITGAIHTINTKFPRLFVDFSNVIRNDYSFADNYTATQDCYVHVYLNVTGTGYANIYVDGHVVSRTFSGGQAYWNWCGYLAKGQVVTANIVFGSGTIVGKYINVYGLK